LIRYLSHKYIEYEKWDRAIASSCYESAYGYSWFLDLAAENWDALVDDDYRAVMPVVWRKKYLLTCLYQPLNTQQLGIFQPVPPERETVKAFLEKIPPKFIMADMCLNRFNDRVTDIVPVDRRVNFELRLDKDYQELCQAYHTNTRRNLAKASQAGLETGTADVESFLELKASQDPASFRRAKYERLSKLLNGIISRNQGAIAAARAGGKLVAAVFWLHSPTRAIYLLPVSGRIGRDARAMFLLVDKFIREHAGTGRILDFEGSNIPSIARFMEGFGPARTVYFRMSMPVPRMQNILSHQI
jgi:hypothetical protein